jgi:putative two-component system response regulator
MPGPTAGPLPEWPFGRDGGDRDEVETLLVVDGEVEGRRFLRGALKAARYRILEAADAFGAQSIARAEHVDLVLAAMSLGPESGLDLCRMLKADSATSAIPVMLVTEERNIEQEIAGYGAGADDLILRPASPLSVRGRVRGVLRTKRVADSLEQAESILYSVARIVDSRDRLAGDHCQRLARVSVLVGSALGLAEDELRALQRGGYLHDIGKIAIPEAILCKAGALDDEEWVQMRLHTTIGESICKPMRNLRDVLPIIRHHHERWDGTGYPDGLKGEQIPLLARIVQLVDIFDAITHQRCYKESFSFDFALDRLEDEVRHGWRDPELFSVFREIMLHSRHLLAPDVEPGPDGTSSDTAASA